jgi:hypothetical protein
VVLGRRGAAQASFTAPELRELGRLESVDMVVDPQNIELDPASQAEIEEDRTAKASLKYLREYALRTEHPAPRRVTLRFLASPVEIVGTGGRVTAVKVEHNELVVDSNGGSGRKGRVGWRSSRLVSCCVPLATVRCQSRECRSTLPPLPALRHEAWCQVLLTLV